uniref:Uncharacterized protein n=2 Tax=Triticum urartu TaxID=4572 RepID=A0A8R7NXX6_TRIUA
MWPTPSSCRHCAGLGRSRSSPIVASIDQCKLHQDVRSVHKFPFGQYMEKKNMEWPTCIFTSSMADYQRARKDGVAEALLTMSSSGQQCTLTSIACCLPSPTLTRMTAGTSPLTAGRGVLGVQHKLTGIATSPGRSAMTTCVRNDLKKAYEKRV